MHACFARIYYSRTTSKVLPMPLCDGVSYKPQGPKLTLLFFGNYDEKLPSMLPGCLFVQVAEF